MSSTALKTTADIDKSITTLEAERSTLRASVDKAPETAKIILLRRAIVDGKNAGEDTSKLETERDELKAKRDARARELGVQLRELHLARRAAESEAFVADLQMLDDEELESQHHAITEARRSLRAQKRAIAGERSRRAALARVKALVASLSEDERAALRAQLASKPQA